MKFKLVEFKRDRKALFTLFFPILTTHSLRVMPNLPHLPHIVKIILINFKYCQLALNK